jgi:hypothetical protein
MMSGIMNMMSGLTGSAPAGPSVSTGSAVPPKPKQKMRGPSINLDDVDKKMQ